MTANNDVREHLEFLHCCIDKNRRSAMNIRWKTPSATKNQTVNELDEAIKLISDLDDDQDIAAIWVNLHQLPMGYTGNAVTTAIKARRFLLIDVDPDRPNATNATAEEKQLASSNVSKISSYLDCLGFPAPALSVDSGNGFHLYYRLDEEYPLSSYGDALIREALRVLSAHFPDAGIDKSVHDRARVVKVAGTMARKGPQSDKRPWRRAKILYRGKGKEVLHVNQLKDAIAMLGGSIQASDSNPSELGEAARNLLELPPETATNQLLLREMLRHISPNVSREEWLPVVWSVASLGWASGQTTAHSWSMQCLARFDQADFDKVWNGYERGRGISPRTLVFLARRGGYAGMSFLTGQLANMYA